MKIKTMPAEERPAERAMSDGVAVLSNRELIALIIRTGTAHKSSLELAESIISSAGGIKGLAWEKPRELMQISGMGTSKACALSAAVELGKRMAAVPKTFSQTVTCASDVAGMFMQELRNEKKEHFKIVLLDSKGHVIYTENVSTGELSGAPVHPREAFSRAVRMSAASVIFVHNHPSGDPEPSDEDIATTKRLVEAGRLLGIKVLDHIITGDGSYISLAAGGYV
ncbi:MAG: RadC family protein [Eubacterium sp.]|jgi:DNA repair protein RadC